MCGSGKLHASGWRAVEKCLSAALRLLRVIAAYKMYASFPITARALHSDIFEQPLRFWG